MLAAASTMAAEPIPAPEFTLKVTTGYIEQEVNHRAGSTGIESDSFYAQGLFTYEQWFSQDWSVFVQGRAIASTDNSAIIDPETDVSADVDANDNVVGELRQAYVEYRGLTSYPNERLRIGLQRLRESSGLWWDEDVESVAWSAETTQMDWLVAVAQQFNLYRTDADLRFQDEDVTRLLASLDIKEPGFNRLGFKLLAVTQNSAQPVITDVPFYGSNRVWLVSEYEHRWTVEPAFNKAWAYRAMASVMFGDNVSNDALNAGVESSVIGSAFDLGVRYDNPVKGMSLGANIIMATGGEDTLFSQNGIHTNRTTGYGTRDYLFKLNEAVRFDLSNIQKLELFAAYRFNAEVSAAVAVASYQKHSDAMPVFVAGRAIQQQTNDGDLGTGIEAAISYYPETARFIPLRYVRFRASGFNPANAFEIEQNDYRVALEAQFTF